MAGLSFQQQCHPHLRSATSTLQFLLSRWTHVYTSSSAPCAVSRLQTTLQGGLCSKGMCQHPPWTTAPTGLLHAALHMHTWVFWGLEAPGKMFRLIRITMNRQLLAMPCSEPEPGLAPSRGDSCQTARPQKSLGISGSGPREPIITMDIPELQSDLSSLPGSRLYWNVASQCWHPLGEE